MRLKVIVTSFWLLLFSVSVNATVVDLTVTASWVAADFDVSPIGTNPPTGLADENDDKVFGIAPSAGSTTFTLRVDTSSAVGFLAGYDNGGQLLTHDWYGFRT